MKSNMGFHDSLLLFLCVCCVLLPVSGTCPGPIQCGYLGKIHFPFDNTPNSLCGGFPPIEGCNDNNSSKPKTVKLGDELYEVKKIYQKDDQHVIILQFKEHHWAYEPCQALDFIAYLSRELSFSILNGIPLLKCNKPLHYDKAFQSISGHECSNYNVYNTTYEASQWSDPFGECSLIYLPFQYQDPYKIDLSDEIYIQVHVSPPCPDGNCKEHKKGISTSTSIIIGVVIGSGGVIIIGLTVMLLLNKRKYKSLASQNKSRSIESDSTHSRRDKFDDTHSNAILESRNIYFGVPLFSYEELEEATNKFDQSKELGSGGFGTVYYGKLKDGREVAVKRLFERSYKRVQQFVNEVKILTRLRHRNLVSLYGCTSRASHELLLVYEYISNGTLACHLHGNLAKPGSLPWPVRMRIAIETANALSYLHACDIIHRDVKSSNLLLDYHFCIKVADFGLSRLFPKSVSHVSTAPAGSPGYLDPEYHQCYQLTEKSDVYSFGVVLVELISSKPAIDVRRHKDEIKLANMAVTKIQKGAFNELVDHSLGFETDNEVKKMIISVAKLAFHCLHKDRELRPSMDQVMEFLQKIENGNHDLEHLEIQCAKFSNREIHASLPTSIHRDGAALLNNSKPQRPPRSL